MKANRKILFLHAEGGSARSWKRQLEFFKGSTAIDLTEETIDGMARQAAAHGPAHVVGLSMGGVVALHLCRIRPELISSLTLACTWAKHPDALEHIRSLDDAYRKMSLADIAATSRPHLLAPDTPREVATEVLRIGAALNPELHQKQWRAMLRADLTDVVPRVPVLLIGGHLDRMAPADTCLRPLQRQIPGSRLIVIPGASHFANQDRPALFNQVLSEFLQWT